MTVKTLSNFLTTFLAPLLALTSLLPYDNQSVGQTSYIYSLSFVDGPRFSMVRSSSMLFKLLRQRFKLQAQANLG
ncbi:hypothetical protein FB446DRAFT_757124 [Lentinula raphanica]|nr:hypothetical protein FB446DRAFT_757124 [Lentinula raphanica]